MTVMTRGAVALIRFYQGRISPKLGYECPETPSCSQYALEVFRRHGFLKAMRLTHHRLCTCEREEDEPPVAHPLWAYAKLACTMLSTLVKPMPEAERDLESSC